MGRKVNPLISEHFDRGARLKDNSNRYQHTCKACGEHFSKGRFEVLLGHVLKRCPSIGGERRRQLVLRHHDLEAPGRSSLQESGRVPSQYSSNLKSIANGASSSYNGLSVLAEASQTVENSRFGALHDKTRTYVYSQQGLPVDPALDVDSFASAYLNMPDDSIEPKTGSPLHPSPPPLSASFSTASTLVEPLSSRLPMSSAAQPTLRAHGPDLESIAASANDIMHMVPDFDISHTAIADDLLLDKPSAPPGNVGSAQQPAPTKISSLFDTVHEPLLSEDHLHTTGSPGSLRRLAVQPAPSSAHFVAETGTPTRARKPKVRGKFTPERRNEVKQIRQLGACMRCRMLKKTCSGGSPCQACAAIDNPRVWKKRCVRTKLVEQFTLFSIGLQSTLAYRELSGIKELTSSEPFDGYIQALHFDHETKSVAFRALRLTPRCSDFATGAKSNISPSAIENELGLAIVHPNIFDRAFDQQVWSYFEKIHKSIVDAEPSPLLRSTLRTAQALLDRQPDLLLKRCTELWSRVIFLVNPALSFKLVAELGDITDATASRQGHAVPGLAMTPTEWPQSCHLIHMQLRAFVEQRVGALAEGIIRDLERRLMEKPQNNHFRTFIATVILMNCVERMSWQYARWTKLTEASWPLEKRPAEYAKEGDSFASVLEGLLELRSIPPKTVVDPIRKIIVPGDATDEVVRGWFEEIAITPDFLRAISDRGLDIDDCRCFDMKLFARWLRPGNPAMKKELVS